MTSDSFLAWLPLFINHMFDTVGFWRMFLITILVCWILKSFRGLLFYSTSKVETKLVDSKK